MRRFRSADWAAAAAVGGAALAVVLGVFWRGAVQQLTTPTVEYYGAFYPNVRYALDSLREGHGLLWNRFQNCGQPFLADLANGVLYPLHLVFLLFGPDVGQFVEIGLHLAVAGWGMYWLGRTVGFGRGAALVAALAFQLSGPVLQLAGGLPTALAAYVWMPAALAALERLLRRPRGGAAVLFAVLLTVQLLAGDAQVSAFTYQIALFRLLWELVVRPEQGRWRTLAWFLAGLALPLALGAAQFLPALELVRESLHAGRLGVPAPATGAPTLGWEALRAAFGTRAADGNVVAAVTFALAGIGIACAPPRGVARSYGVLGVLAVALGFDNLVFALHGLLPVVTGFAQPHHWLWVAGLSACLLAGFGVDVLADAGGAALRQRAAVIEGAAAAALLFALVSPALPPPAEVGLLALLAVVIGLGCTRAAGRAVIPYAALAVVVAGSLLVSGTPSHGPLLDGAPLYVQRQVFDWLVRQRLTPLDRMYQFGGADNFTVTARAASLFRVPSITDVGSASRRYAALTARLFHEPQRPNGEAAEPAGEGMPRNRALFDLLATRYVVTDQPRIFAEASLPPLKELAAFDETRVYENPAALPRAFFVPQLAGVGSAPAALQWFASGLNNPRRFAVVDEPPPDFFSGSAGTIGAGTVAVLDDLGEEVALRVRAPWGGFVVLTDQYYPGWEASVNGVATPVIRADYAFRAIKVPVGESTVLFRYRPVSLWIGVAVSALTAAALAIALLVAARRARRRAAAARAGARS